jgi:RNA polymerase sigma-70 factor (ECF subfamily)
VSAPAEAQAPKISDEALVQSVVSGDASAAGELYDRLIGIVSQTIYRILGRRGADHEDLVQATFEQIVITLVERRFAGACSLTTWASSLAAHVSLNALRSRRVEHRILDRHYDVDRHSGVPAAHEDVEQRANAREQIERIREHLGAMNPAKAEAVLLHDVLGHDLAEIAVLTGASVAAAQSRLVRGRAELMRRLAKTLPSGGGRP